MANIKVAVRVRPISQREINVTGADVVVHTDSREISLTNLKVSSSKAGDSRERTRRYTFDYCFDSSDPSADNYAGQEKIYDTIGNSVLDGIFGGYNSCLVAYGQSASGKTHTMMGTKDDPGLIPRICRGMFLRISERNEINEESFRINVSYLEVYNERVRDLLKPSTSSNGLRVREHPRLGPYVQGLTQHQVESLSSLMFRVEEGTKARKTASTLQNPTSSRSHALLTLTLEPCTSSTTGNCASLQTPKTSTSRKVRNCGFNKGSKLHLVDLAGSENAAACPGINRLKEGANINKSLVALGNVISALAERGSSGSNPGRRFIPYRDSALTWLLKDSLGGNATTIMLATISPASGSFNETSHTLRFAQRAQSVINRPVINEDPVAKIIRELRSEVARLKSLLLEKNIEPNSDLKPLPCVCKHNQERQDFQTRCVSTSTSNSPTPDSVSSSVSLTRRHSTSDCAIPKYITNETPIHFGSLEVIGSINDGECNTQLTNYNCARISQLTEEINEPVFVDIPTLVAVLIKPDNSVQPNSHQIEEISSEGAPEDSIDNVFNSVKTSENFDAKQNEKVNNENLSVNNVESHGPSFHVIDNSVIKNVNERPKLRKQQSTDSNLHSSSASVLTTTKRYGSSEAIGKRTQPPVVLQRSQTTLEKRVNLDKPKKLNNIREIEDKSDKTDDPLRDKSLTKQKTNSIRKQSIDILKRRTSKDSSSSSSKEDTATNSTKDSRKNSVDSEQLPSKPHTIIQRARRADIVAAVTERLYSSRKTSEESTTASTPASDIRSPENTEVKLASTTRMRLQEISRKMLAKRRRICVDTQTDALSTVRVKDKSINVREPKPLRKDASVLTERHENYQLLEPCDKVVVRVKEMSTSTSDAPDKPLVYFKDAANITEHCSDHYDSMELCQHDSGILYDDFHYDNAVEMAESSMNTNLPVQPSCSASQTSREDTRTCCDDKHHPKSLKLLHAPQKDKECCPSQSFINDVHHDEHEKACSDVSQASAVHEHSHDHKNNHNHSHHSHLPIVKACCSSDIHDSHKHTDDCEKSKIHINLPDMINITIESPNVLESKIQVYDTENLRRTVVKKDCETQTDKKDALEIGTLTDENLTRLRVRDLSTTTTTRPSQTDGRTFRIENIFQDPHCGVQSNSASIDVLSGIPSNCYDKKNSIVFTNSIGTSPTMRSRDNENFYDCRALSPTIRRKSLTSEWFTRPTSTWPSMSRWRSQSPLGFSKQYSYSMSSEKYPIASNCYNVRDGNNDTTDYSSWCENYNINKNECEQKSVNKIRATKIQDKLPSLMYPCGSVTNEGLRSSSVIGKIDRKGVYEQETNFSDDSLDSKEERVRHQTGDIKSHVIIKDNATNDSNENKCPPDVVAHTKKDTIDETLCTEVISDFDDAYIELPKTKLTGFTEDLKTPIQQFKSMILGVPLMPLLLNSENDTPANDNVLLNKSRVNKKRVSFGESSVVIEPEASPLRDYQEFADSPKSIIKLNSPESIERKISWKQSSELKQSQQSNLSNQITDNDTSVITNEKSIKSQNIIDEYLDEALIFMRNINSINKYINTDNETTDKCQVMRERLEIPLIEFKDLNRNSVMKEEDLEPSTYSPYEKCLRSMERLEQCLSRVKCNDDVLEMKYDSDDRNSAEAKLDLACFSSDSCKQLFNGKFQDESLSLDDISITYNNNYKIEKYFHKSVDNYDNDDGNNFDSKTLDRYRKLLDKSRCKNSIKKRSRSLTTSRVRDHDLDNSNIYPKLMNDRLDEDALIARVKKSLPTPRCSITKYDSSDESSSSDEALATFIESIDKVSRSKDKFKYPASPRVKFLQLLSERRRIVENSRSTGAS